MHDPREMRKAIQRAARDGRMGEDRGPFCLSIGVGRLVSAVEVLARHEGLSGEDHMTVLAYQALAQLEAMQDRELEMLAMQPPPLVVVSSAA